jgi:hypothetical protein
MSRARHFSQQDLDFLRTLYTQTLALANAIYGKHLFRPFDSTENKWESKAHKAFYDAVMVGLASVLEHKEELLANRHKILERTKSLFVENEPGTFTGRGNSKKDVQERIETYKKMLITSLNDSR